MEIREELCFLKPMYGTTKGEDILKTFTDHVEDRGIDIRKGFCYYNGWCPCYGREKKSLTNMVEGCVKLKVSRYSPEITTLAKEKQGQGSH